MSLGPVRRADGLEGRENLETSGCGGDGSGEAPGAELGTRNVRVNLRGCLPP